MTSKVVRTYWKLLRLMPPAVWTEDGEEMARTFAAVWAERRSGPERGVTLIRVFSRLLLAIVLEWWDVVAAVAAPGGRTRRRRGRSGGWRVVRQSARSLARSPAFTWSVVLLLALGIGSVTTIFTLFDHVVLRPLPYPASERLVSMRNGAHSFPMFEDFRRFRSVELWGGAGVRETNLTGGGRPSILRESHVSRDFFMMFGARPALGRLFVEDDFRTGEGIVLSHGMWQRVFGGDRDVLGRDVVINGEPARVVGVLASTFLPPSALVGTNIDLFRPFQPTDPARTARSTHVLSIAGRLRPGVGLASVAREAEALAEWRAAEFPEQYLDREGNPRPLTVTTLQEATSGRAREGLGLLLGAVTLLLLVACTNVAQLVLARGLSRIREVAVRRALGAPTRSIMNQLLVESLLVAGGGTLLGVALAILGLRGFLRLNPETLPRTETIAIDPRILLFTVLLGAATAVLFGLLPGVRFAGRDILGALQLRTRSSTEHVVARRARSSLVVAQIALSLVLLTHASSLLHSVASIQARELGFRTENVWALPLSPAGLRDADEWRRRMEAIRASLAETAGVRAATFGITMPLEFTGGSSCCWSNRVVVEGVESRADVMLHAVDVDYFDVLDLRFVAGAPWQRGEENAELKPTLLSEAVAIEFFGSPQRAIGRQIRTSMEGEALNIIGVVEDNLHYGPDQPPLQGLYLPTTAITWPGRAVMAVLVNHADAGLADRLREAVWRVEPDLPVPTVRPLASWASQATAAARFESLLFTTFGVVALLLVATGLYGTLLYAVGQRRRELGIRLALGDAPVRLERRVLLQGVGIAALGCAVGVVGARAFGQFLESRVFGIAPADLKMTGAALTILLIVAAAASWLPARRAGATDPMEALRTE